MSLLTTISQIIGTTHQLEPFIADFVFSVQEIRSSVEIMLIIHYKTIHEWNQRHSSPNLGRFIVFREQNFEKLKEIFTDDFLAQFEEKSLEQRRIEELFQ